MSSGSVVTAQDDVRILLFTGKGGVGKSTMAAGTATLAARSGRRTLVPSTDAAHSLADAYGVTAGHEPTEVEPDLHLQQVDAQRLFERSWADIQRYLLSVLDIAGVDPVAAEELTVIPGAEEVLALLELRQHARSGRYDVIVVDCAPTAETLRLLALPEALGWYMTRVFPVERRVVKALNTLNADLMARPALLADPGTVFVSGNDPAAKDTVTGLLKDFGHEDVIDLGDITTARGTEMLLPVWLRLWGALGTPAFNFKIVR